MSGHEKNVESIIGNVIVDQGEGDHFRIVDSKAYELFLLILSELRQMNIFLESMSDVHTSIKDQNLSKRRQ